MSQTYPQLSQTNFPDSYDAWDRFLDPTISTISIIRQFEAFYSDGNFEAANELIKTNPILKQMIVNADNLNKFRDSIIALEQFYFDDVQQYLVNIVKPMGEWSTTKKYTKYNVVTGSHNNGMETFMCIHTNTPIGTSYLDLNYWVSLTMRGEQGESGTGLTPRGFYDLTTAYYKDDMVSHNNTLWGAELDSVGEVPNKSSDSWYVIMEFNGDLLLYDNSGSSLKSTTIQNAITELDRKTKITNNINLPSGKFVNNKFQYHDNSITKYMIPFIIFAKKSIPDALKSDVTVESFNGYLEFRVARMPANDLLISSLLLRTSD